MTRHTCKTKICSNLGHSRTAILLSLVSWVLRAQNRVCKFKWQLVAIGISNHSPSEPAESADSALSPTCMCKKHRKSDMPSWASIHELNMSERRCPAEPTATFVTFVLQWELHTNFCRRYFFFHWSVKLLLSRMWSSECKVWHKHGCRRLIVAQLGL